MSTNFYDIGDPVELRATLTLETSGDPFDPDSVALKVLNKNAEVVEYVYGTDAELERLEEGVYRLIYRPSIPGDFTYRYEIEDDDNHRYGSQEGRFRVRYTLFESFATTTGDGAGSEDTIDGGSP